MPMDKLPGELSELVHISAAILGEEIKRKYGLRIYKYVEAVRLLSKKTREARYQADLDIFSGIYKKLAPLSSADLLNIAHSYSLYLELVNRCESAYRAFRLEQKKFEFKKAKGKTIFVFTSHPTESRNIESLGYFKKIEESLKQFLVKKDSGRLRGDLSLYLNLLTLTSLYKRKRPSVEAEAYQIYLQILHPAILDTQIGQNIKGNSVQFRSWTGGDKDGHPFVNEHTLLISLQISRTFLIEYSRALLKDLKSSFSLSRAEKPRKIVRSLSSFSLALRTIETVGENDGLRVSGIKSDLRHLENEFQDFSASVPHSLTKLLSLFELYPALVVPMEIREDSELVKAALADKDAVIVKMIRLTAAIAKGMDPHCYVRGFVLSMVRNAQDIENGIKLVNKVFGRYALRVIPLLETQQALLEGPEILKSLLSRTPGLKREIKKEWDGVFEIMLGYSDSSKESGLLRGKLLISKAIRRLDKFIRSAGLRPVFFHGSGGSVERGGGSVKEQISWWPNSAKETYKVTVQGEMVTRNFGEPLIMKSQIYKINGERSKLSTSKGLKISEELEKLSVLSADKYKELITNPDFIEIIKHATPYSFLEVLKIGSRPNKRQQKSGGIKLRAIPWVLCWTQTRALFPSWWGLGSGYQVLSSSEKRALHAEFKTSDFLRSFIMILGFTLEKIELPVFELYLRKLSANPAAALKLMGAFRSELVKTKRMAKEISGKDSFLWHRPWLKQSITCRSSMIHPLNVIQVLAIEREDRALLQETIVGIACGMMTTG